jgi:hypothetical protein
MTPEDQDVWRNTILAIKGHIRKLRKEQTLSDQDHALILVRLKKLDKILGKCNKT